MSVVEDVVARKTASLWPHLDERQRRLVLGAEARELGRGGVKLVAAAAGVSPDTVAKGLRELESGAAPTGRVRRPGGGRKALTATDPGLLAALEALVDPATRGDPMSALRWTSKSTPHVGRGADRARPSGQFVHRRAADDERVALPSVTRRINAVEPSLLSGPDSDAPSPCASSGQARARSWQSLQRDVRGHAGSKELAAGGGQPSKFGQSTNSSADADTRRSPPPTGAG